MICPRCGKDISDSETICPFCYQGINRNIDFNDYRQDGFVQIQTKENADPSEPINYAPKYFNISQFNVFVVAIVFILGVAAFTVFSLNFVQNNESRLEPTENVTEYVVVPTEPPTTPEVTEPPTVKNTVKSFSIKNLYGSWKMADAVEQEGLAIPYFTFFSDGVAQENYGSIVYGGLFKDESNEKKHSVYIELEGNLDGLFEFELTGNSKDGYTLTLTKNSGAQYKLVKVKNPKSYSLSTMKDYKIDKDLIGVWKSKDGDKDYRFNKNGTLVRNTGYTTMNTVWTIDDGGQITLKYMRDHIITLRLNYTMSNDKKRIKINNVIYYKD
ncbi:MAG: hypothetical protein J1E96_06915 [Ruminococcus sp.]|nr:hypothetical protein [Ruminococcus sp.]